jgi:thiol-disulfide isomerase/thioredoxin
MKRLATLALTLSLCLLAHADASARRASSSNMRAASADGIPRARARISRRRRARTNAQPTSAQSKKSSAANPTASPSPTSAKPVATPSATTAAPFPVVTELDIEGLKKLMQRGDDPSKAKPLLVNFWATWCDPCRAEFPDLVRVNDDYKNRGLEFVVVSGDDVSDIKTSVPKFLQEMHATMPAYLLNVLDMGEAINAVDTTWGGELPATYLFDKSGQVAFKHVGRVDTKELRAALDKVLTEK